SALPPGDGRMCHDGARPLPDRGRSGHQMLASCRRGRAGVSAPELIDVEDASVRFAVRGGLFARRRYVHAVERLSLSLQPNETVALVGESGSGKTTLGLAILRLRALSGGAIRWRGNLVSDLSGTEL